ncbi:mitochondrial inner membrane protein Mitofilin [Suillus subaureus]|uniref:MICOS complex subunit MIC60 n=1 Tax=Suillus subaureus TaxID=48587 RepID=A0A9P7EHJ6_9AGAM|nr:mitochondrial inner membrane protein Mitofilin [Suillus subaureus]KAG1821095.1 mitochondrial inner membrane protein Mitofilin [Suillus subaureus]
MTGEPLQPLGLDAPRVSEVQYLLMDRRIRDFEIIWAMGATKWACVYGWLDGKYNGSTEISGPISVLQFASPVFAVLRHVPATVGRGLVRTSRKRLASTTSTSNASSGSKPAKVVRRILLYTVATTGTFYIGSAFVSFENQQYRELFTENLPLGKELVEYGEAHKWDEITVEQVVVATVDAYKTVYNFVQPQLGNAPTEATIEKTAKSALQESKERVKSAAASLKTVVKKVEEETFADELDELIRRAEASLAGKPVDSLHEATTTPAQPGSSADTISPRDDTDLIIVSDKNPDNVIVYAAPLPIGFEPPPGYERPVPPKPAPKADAEPTPVPLPLVAPAVSEVAVSEPVITQLASTIDNLASFLASNPAASEKAKDVLEVAKGDLTGLAARIEKIKEDEKLQLEMKLDEQAREYTTKLLELELEAQDKLDSQQDGFRKFYDEERGRFAQVYREKLEQELRTQTELINERLKEEVIAQGIEMQRRWIREVKVRVEQERGGRLAKLDELATSLKRLERLALDNSSYLDENIRVHSMWTAIRAMQSAVDASIRKPFREELRVLRHIAVAKEDVIIAAALDSLEQSDVPDIGVEPFADLASWFSTSVRPRVSSVALVPDRDAAAWTRPGSDVLSVLSRAEYYMNEKDLDSAARELNQVKGTARELLHDWLEAARRRLEVLQALEVIQSQATLASLLVV